MRKISHPLIEDLKIKLTDTNIAVEKTEKAYGEHPDSKVIATTLESLYKRRATLTRRLKEATECAT